MKLKMIYAVLLAVVFFTDAKVGGQCESGSDCDGGLICTIASNSSVCSQSDGSASSACNIDSKCAGGLCSSSRNICL